MSKGQGLSITTIVVAVLALIVLIVLTLVFTGKLGNFQESSTEVQADAVLQAKALGFVGNSCDDGKGTCRLTGDGRTGENPSDTILCVNSGEDKDALNKLVKCFVKTETDDKEEVTPEPEKQG